MQNKKIKILTSLLIIPLAGLIIFFITDKNRTETAINKTLLSQPNDKNFFETAFTFTHQRKNLSNQNVLAGIIPHHLLAADMIAEFFSNLAGKNYDTIVLIGPNHYNTGNADIITSSFDWQTPYGILECDQNLLKIINKKFDLEINEEVMKNEHAINSEVSFIKKTFPQAQILPLIIKSGNDLEKAENLANELKNISQNKNILVLASVDFSHYKNNLQAQADNQESLEAIYNFDFDNIKNINVDSPASLFCLLKYVNNENTYFDLLQNSNSALLSGNFDLESTTSYITGYFSQGTSEIKLLFLGDVMLDRSVKTKIDKDGLDSIFKSCSDIFYDYDIVSANLEGPLTNNGEHYPPVNTYDFAFDPQDVFELKKYNFNFFNLANNHFNDQGEQGVEETRNNLDVMDFDYVGCNYKTESDCANKIIQLKDKKIGLVGLSIFNYGFDLEEAKKIIAELKKQTDLIVVNIHWGEEYQTDFNPRQQNIGHALVDAGADVIIGHHPHVSQGMEKYGNGLIFYSLGNFIFDQYFSKETQQSYGVELSFENNELSFELIPFSSDMSEVNVMEGDEKENFLSEVLKNYIEN